MADFFERRDVTTAAAFTDAAALFDLGFASTQQALFNASDEALEISFNGVDVHGRLETSGPTQGINWYDHQRTKIYVRRTAVGAGPKLIEVYANTR